MSKRKAVCPECGSPRIMRGDLYRRNEGYCEECGKSWEWSDRVFHQHGIAPNVRKNNPVMINKTLNWIAIIPAFMILVLWCWVLGLESLAGDLVQLLNAWYR